MWIQMSVVRQGDVWVRQWLSVLPVPPCLVHGMCRRCLAGRAGAGAGGGGRAREKEAQGVNFPLLLPEPLKKHMARVWMSLVRKHAGGMDRCGRQWKWMRPPPAHVD